MASTLVQLLTAFRQAGIQAIPFKGPVLAVSAYGDLNVRRFGDLDILIRPRDAGDARRLPLAQGYASRLELDWQHSFSHPQTAMAVDLHTAFALLAFPIHVDFDRVWHRRRPCWLRGQRVMAMSSEDTVLVLCIQVAKDGASNRLQLAKVADLAAHLRSTPQLNWRDVLRQSRRMRIRRILNVGLVLAGNVVGADVAAAADLRPERDRRARMLANQLAGCFYTSEGRSGTIDWRRFHSEVREHWWDRTGHRYVRLLLPNERDRSVLELPRALSFLYLLVRPLRLVGKYLLRPALDLVRRSAPVR